MYYTIVFAIMASLGGETSTIAARKAFAPTEDHLNVSKCNARKFRFGFLKGIFKIRNNFLEIGRRFKSKKGFTM